MNNSTPYRGFTTQVTGNDADGFVGVWKSSMGDGETPVCCTEALAQARMERSIDAQVDWEASVAARKAGKL